MPFYYVNHRTRDALYPPLAGEDFAEMAAVRVECLVGAKQMIADGMTAGSPLSDLLDQAFEVTDSDGNVVLTVPFSDAVEADTQGAPAIVIPQVGNAR